MSNSAPRLLLALILAAPFACGDNGGTGSATDPSGTSVDTTSSTTADATGDATASPTSGGATATGDATASPTSGGATANTDTTADATSDAATDAATDGSTTASTSATSDASESASSTGGEEALPPTDSADALEQWLAGGAYKSWPAESQVHPSDGPHGGNVRTYINSALAQSLADGAAMHPEGAATVKELYGESTDTIIGYAVMVKLAPESAGGDNWYWYERLNASVYADGTGVGLCTGCHALGGADYILTPYPLQ